MILTQALLDKLELLLQDTDFISNLLYRLIAWFNLYGVKCLICMDSCYAYPPVKYRFLRFCDFVSAVPGHLLCAGQQLVQWDFFRVFSPGQNVI